MVELVFLGTGSSVMPGRRAHSSIAVKISETQTILFDAGPPLTQRLWAENIDIKTIKTIFVSHMHPDHVIGLPLLFHELKALGVREGPLVIVPAGERERALKLIDSYGPSGFTANIEEAEPESRLFFDWGEIAFRKTNHPITTLAFKAFFKNKGKSVFYSSDTSYSESLKEFAKADVGIHEATIPVTLEEKGRELGMHSSPRQALNILEKSKIKILTHISLMSMKGFSYDGVTEFIIAEDGLRILL